jgi:hypothetical protein
MCWKGVVVVDEWKGWEGGRDGPLSTCSYTYISIVCTAFSSTNQEVNAASINLYANVDTGFVPLSMNNLSRNKFGFPSSGRIYTR